MDDLATGYANAISMRAIGMTEFPEIGRVADRLQMLKVPVPRLGNGEVAIKLAASSMHIDEIYAAQGTALGRFYGPKNLSEAEPFLLGSSVSGTVVALGERVESFEIGQDVIVIPNEMGACGSWANYLCVDKKWVMGKPAQLTHVDAAAVTMASCVAWGAIGFANIEAGGHCAVIGASGAVGVMVLQYLETLGCYTTAVCSGANDSFVRRYGADHVVDYKQQDFADAFTTSTSKYDAIFDCVGGQEIEDLAFRSLRKSGVFITVVGPKRHVGEEKLSWPSVLKIMAHIGWRMMTTRIRRGPRYTFSAKFPRHVIENSMARLLKHDLRMPIASIVPFELDDIANSVRLLQTHRAKGRIVIDFGLS